MVGIKVSLAILLVFPLFAQAGKPTPEPATAGTAVSASVPLAPEIAVKLALLNIPQQQYRRILEEIAKLIDELTRKALERETELQNALIAEACGKAQFPIAECRVDLAAMTVRREPARAPAK
jgi:hypothetical protein